MSSVGKIRVLAAIAMLFGVGLATYGVLNYTPSGPGIYARSYGHYEGTDEQEETKHSYGAYYGVVSVVLGVILWVGVAPRYDSFGPHDRT